MSDEPLPRVPLETPLEERLQFSSPLSSDEIPGGCHWSFVMKRGHLLRLIDVEGDANVGMLFFNPLNPLERYNAPDTLKCQHTFKLTRGHCLYSDMGRIFCSIVADSCGWHDTVCGNSNRELISKRWGERNYQHYRNERYLSGHDSFLTELAKYGLGRRDLAANVNWFSKVETDAGGNLRRVAGHSPADAQVDLRFEMDTLVLLHTCPHPLDLRPDYPRRALRYEIHRAPPIAADDCCEHACPENERGFINTRLYQLQD